jgi:excisionase family DNA binding protein
MNDEIKTIIKAIELYAARHPRPPQVTIGQAAEMLGLSRWTVSKMVEHGTLKLNKCGRIPIEQVDAALQPA